MRRGPSSRRVTSMPGRPTRAQHVDPLLEAGHHGDRSGEIELGHVMDTVGLGAVAAHVMHHSPGGHHQPVAALLDPLDMTMYWMFCDLGPIDQYRAGPPGSPQIGGPVHQWFGAGGQDRRWHGGPIATRWGVSHGDVPGPHGWTQRLWAGGHSSFGSVLARLSLRPRQVAVTDQRCRCPGTPLSSRTPRSAKETPAPSTKSTTVLVTITSPASPSATTRAATCTAMPLTS